MSKKVFLFLIMFFSLNTILNCSEKAPSWDEIYSKKHKIAHGWKFIVIHHSGTDTGNAASFHRYHTQKGYGGLCYHFVIGNGNGADEGGIVQGFRWNQQLIGTHLDVKSWYHNIFGIGICLVGNFDKTLPGNKQMKSLKKLINTLRRKYNIPVKNIIGHREAPVGEIKWNSEKISVIYKKGKFASTGCPGKRFSMDKLRSSIK